MIQFQGIGMQPQFAEEAEALMKRRQTYVDKECVRLMEPYTPMRTGTKIDISASGTDPGSGILAYSSGIARRNYYTNKGTGKGGMNAKSGKGLRGKYWFERMKADHKDEILQGAKEIK